MSAAAIPFQQVARFSRIWREAGRKKYPWYAQAIFADGTAADFGHFYKTKKEALAAAVRIDIQMSGERDRRDLIYALASSDLIDRPSRTPYFYKSMAIRFSRDERTARWSRLVDSAPGAKSWYDTCQSLAKMYLKSYRAALAVWQKRFEI